MTRRIGLTSIATLIAGLAVAPHAEAVMKVCGTSHVCTVETDGSRTCRDEQYCNYYASDSDLEFLYGRPSTGPISRLPGENSGGSGSSGRSGKKDPCKESAAAAPGSTPAVATSVGNPIDIATGQKTESERDFYSEGGAPLSFVRTYRSMNTSVGLLGKYWESNFDYRILTAGSNLTLRVPGEGTFTFVPHATLANTWVSNSPGVLATISRNGAGAYSATWTGDSIQTYNSTGYPTSVKDLRGVGYDFAYDGTGKLYRVTAAGGRYIQFAWSGSQLVGVTDPAGNNYSYSYYPNKFGTNVNLLSTVTYPGQTSASVTYHYESTSFPGGLTGKSLGGVRFSWFSYDSSNRAISTEHRIGSTAIERYSFVYTIIDDQTISVSETSPLGKQAVYRFVKGSLESVTGLPSASCPASLFTRTFDSAGHADIVTDFNDNRDNLDFDASGRLIQEVKGYGTTGASTTTYGWDTTTNRVTSITVAGDHVETLGYTSDGLLQSSTVTNISPNGTSNQSLTTAYSYGSLQSSGMYSSVTRDGPLPGSGDAVTKTFNANGDLTSIANALGTVVAFSNYNGLGLPGTVTNSDGVVLTYSYDNRGRVLSVSRNVGGVVTVSSKVYDIRGRVTAATELDNRPRTYLYDNADRLTNVTELVSDPGDPETYKNNWTFAYNAISAPVERRVNTLYSYRYFDPEVGHNITDTYTMDDVVKFLDYDELGRTKAQRGTHGQNVRYGYDASSNITSVTDSRNNVTTVAYDGQNRVQSTTDAKGIVQFTYDSAGRVKSVTDRKGLVTSYVYDGLGQLLQVQSPDGGTTTYSYDSYGRIGGSYRGGLYNSYTYDSLGRITQLGAGFDIQTFSYDNCTNGKGRLCRVTDTSGSTAYSYALNGKVSQQTNTIGGTSYVTAYSYDSYDRLIGLTYPDGKSATYTYDKGALATISAIPGTSSVPVINGISFLPSGQMAILNFGNGLTKSFGYDSDGRLISSSTAGSNGVVQGLSIGYDSDNYVTTIGNLRSSMLSQSFAYDAVGSLTSAVRGDGTSEVISYDANGNRKSLAKAGVTTSYSYTAGSNRLESSTGAGVSRIWTYDSAGRSNGFIGADNQAVGFHYDDSGRIDSSSRALVSTYYTNNGLGQRVSKNGPYGETRYIFSPDGTLLSELKVGGAWTDYVRMGDEVVGLMRSGILYYVHNDQIGRPEVVTNAARAAVWTASNYAFDRVVTSDSIGGLSIGFPGQTFDQETGLYYNVFREYDATVGRYIQSDPIGQVGGLNIFLYGQANPVSFSDPLGLKSLCDALREMAANPQLYDKVSSSSTAGGALQTIEPLPPGGEHGRPGADNGPDFRNTDGINPNNQYYDVGYVQRGYALTRHFGALPAGAMKVIWDAGVGCNGGHCRAGNAEANLHGFNLGQYAAWNFKDFKSFVDSYCPCGAKK